jgi:hypothetical protein
VVPAIVVLIVIAVGVIAYNEGRRNQRFDDRTTCWDCGHLCHLSTGRRDGRCFGCAECTRLDIEEMYG